MESRFTVKEIQNYIKSQDSLGDVMYNLSTENIDKANIEWEQVELLDSMPEERQQDWKMKGSSPMGKEYTATGIYVCGELERIEDIEEL